MGFGWTEIHTCFVRYRIYDPNLVKLGMAVKKGLINNCIAVSHEIVL